MSSLFITFLLQYQQGQIPSYSHPQKGQPYTTDHSSVTLRISHFCLLQVGNSAECIVPEDSYQFGAFQVSLVVRIAVPDCLKAQQCHFARLATVQDIVDSTISNLYPYIPEDLDGAAASTFYVGNRREKGTVEIRKKRQ